MTPEQLFTVGLLGAIIGLDVVSFPQAMISRPLVAATIAGMILGDAAGGLLVGATLELIALETLPVGASRYPEWGSASVVGGALFALRPGPTAGALTMAVLGALATAWIGGWTMYVIRRFNGAIARRWIPTLGLGSGRAVIAIQTAGITADFARGGALTLIAMLTLDPLSRAMAALWSLDARLSRAVVIAAAAAVAAGATWKLFHNTPGARWYLLGGLAIGLALVMAR
ncbi:MAG TPA: PTS sugar transporter subunit IIC [Gemmatimonadaceae bacterium]|nr:PTS sugar transporter subunit IIC [Gemmatimonadaceae bacterium]